MVDLRGNRGRLVVDFDIQHTAGAYGSPFLLAFKIKNNKGLNQK